MKKIYIASPYSHPSALVRERRFRQAAAYAGYLIQQGHRLFSPIAHSHPIVANWPATPNTKEAWMLQDLPMIREWADEVHVLKLEEWYLSWGVGREIQETINVKKPIVYVVPPTEIECIGLTDTDAQSVENSVEKTCWNCVDGDKICDLTDEELFADVCPKWKQKHTATSVKETR